MPWLPLLSHPTCCTCCSPCVPYLLAYPTCCTQSPAPNLLHPTPFTQPPAPNPGTQPAVPNPLQAACAPKELKELVNLPNIGVHAAPGQLSVSEQDVAEMKATRMKRRIFDLVSTVRMPCQNGARQNSQARARLLPGDIMPRCTSMPGA
jgi:hypothetical protein